MRPNGKEVAEDVAVVDPVEEILALCDDDALELSVVLSVDVNDEVALVVTEVVLDAETVEVNDVDAELDALVVSVLVPLEVADDVPE
jgi:hypothetical protein